MGLTLRTFLGLCALLSAFIVVHAAPPIWPDIDFIKFETNKETQVKGQTIRFTGSFHVNNFGENDITYCGFKNENNTGPNAVVTSIGAAGIRFKQQRTLEKAKWYLKEVRQFGRIVWEFTPRGYALTQDRTYTVRAVVKVAKDTPANSYLWRFFCESKYTFPNGTTPPGYYPFGKIFKEVPLVAGTGNK